MGWILVDIAVAMAGFVGGYAVCRVHHRRPIKRGLWWLYRREREKEGGRKDADTVQVPSVEHRPGG